MFLKNKPFFCHKFINNVLRSYIILNCNNREKLNMKGILKGFVFSFALSLVLFALAAILSLKIRQSEMAVRIVLWGGLCFCSFLGAFFVSSAAVERKVLKGIICAAAFSATVFVFVPIVSGGKMFSSMLAALSICMAVSGAIGGFLANYR